MLACALLHAGAGWSSALELDRTARILAGIEVARADELALAEDARVRYARRLSEGWEAYQRAIGRPLQDWARSELPVSPGATIFYPFAGPDFPSVYGFYPRAARYVLIALQHAEPPPALNRQAPDVVYAFLERFSHAWESFGRIGFFRTDDLVEESRREDLRAGTTTPLLAFAARLGHTIMGIEPVRVNSAGTDLEPHPGDRLDARTWSSVRIALRRGDRTVWLDYVRADLSDAGLTRSPAVRTWIERMAAHPTLLKAASHLLQRPSFSILRDAILAHAPSVVQDESGIDYRELARAFQVTLYGRFSSPHPLFAPDAQRSLAEAYERAQGLKPLNFRISYQRQGSANLQVAVRTQGDPAAQSSAGERVRALEASIATQISKHATRARKLFLTRTASDPLHAEYVHAVRERLAQAFKARGLAGAGDVLVSLDISPAGVPQAVVLERGTGDAAFDRRLKTLLEQERGFPPWPPALKQQADVVIVTLYLPG